MVTLRSLASRFFALFQRRELDDRVGEELQFHLRMQTEENIRRGMDPQKARSAAHRNVGNTTQVCEEVYRMNTIAFLDETARNVHISLRTLGRNPGFALSAVLVLALAGVAFWGYSKGTFERTIAFEYFAAWIGVATSAAGVFGFTRATSSAVTAHRSPPAGGAGSDRTAKDA